MGDGFSSQDALRGAQRGDGEAFEVLWQHYGPLLELSIRTRFVPVQGPVLRARLVAALPDLLQGIAAKVVRGLPGFSYQGAGSLLRWMKTIARNEVLSWFESKEGTEPAMDQLQHASSSSDAPLPHPAAAGAGPSTCAIKGEEVADLQAALQTLPEDQRELALLYSLSVPWAEVCEVVGGTTEDAVRMAFSQKVLPALTLALQRVRLSRLQS